VPYNLSVAAEQAVLVTLDDREALMRNVDLIVAERERLVERLSAIPWLRPYPSTANFVLCAVAGMSAREVRDDLRSRGILIRYFDSPMLCNCIRVSVGKPGDTDRLIAAVNQIGAGVRG
jgi:histidinol-phosphate aminotransferase